MTILLVPIEVQNMDPGNSKTVFKEINKLMEGVTFNAHGLKTNIKRVILLSIDMKKQHNPYYHTK
jgi:hypothetical protein